MRLFFRLKYCIVICIGKKRQSERGNPMNKKLILSGIQPSGTLTLGNYLGALKNWVNIQEEYDCMYFIADLHAITVQQDPKLLRENTKKALIQYLACGLNPNKNVIFVQSHVSQHAELAWILDCNTYMGELSRMTQFKDKSKKQTNVRVGLFNYPVLMASDILLYQPDYVPVGEDQRQHLELTRNIAQRFNATYNTDIFKIPEPYISTTGAKVMSLKEPEKKMSKSDPNPQSFISLMDDRDTIIKKFKKATTDSMNQVRFSDEQPGIKNLINIYSCMTGKTPNEIEKEFDGVGYGQFKTAVGEVVADNLESIQKKYNELDKAENESYINEILNNGAETARKKAKETLEKVYDTVGFFKQ